jgi:hypothetical protein
MAVDKFALILSVEGKDVEEATAADLILDDELIHLKVQNNQDPPHAGVISLIFTGSVGYSSKTVLYSFKHGYTHRPSVQALAVTLVSGNDRSSMLPTGPAQYTLNMEADETNVYLYVEPNAGAFTPVATSFSIRYQVYVDEAA